MARSIEQQLAALKAPAVTIDELRKALTSPSGIVVAAAAKRAAQDRVEAVCGDMVEAFPRLVGDAKRDPSCRGKIAIARALHEVDHWDDGVFVAGLTIAQLEGWGESRDDTAAELRGVCGLAHAHFGRREALDVLAGLLADRERTTRLAAAQGIADCGRPEGTALVRYKLLVQPDDEPEVLGACCEALLALDRDGSIGFLTRLLDGPCAEAAALALGGARIREAIDALIEWTDRCTPEPRHRVAYLALALMRDDRATAYLLDAIGKRGKADAVAAARALATFKDDPAVVEQIRGAATDAAIRRAIDELLD